MRQLSQFGKTGLEKNALEKPGCGMKRNDSITLLLFYLFFRNTWWLYGEVLFFHAQEDVLQADWIHHDVRFDSKMHSAILSIYVISLSFPLSLGINNVFLKHGKAMGKV